MALAVGVCKLCLQTKPLLKKSHIIPDTLYDQLYDTKHALKVLTKKDRTSTSSSVSSLPTAPYEGNILCRHCDNVTLGGLDDYASRLLLGKGPTLSPQPTAQFHSVAGGGGMLELDNFDYRQFKLFLMSVFWRAHHSQQRFFSEVQLGPYEERFRDYLQRGMAPPPEDLPFYLAGWRDDVFPTDVVLPPVGGRWGTQAKMYLIAFRGLIVYLIFPSHRAGHPLEGALVSDTGQVQIPHMNYPQFLRFFGKYWKR